VKLTAYNTRQCVIAAI